MTNEELNVSIDEKKTTLEAKREEVKEAIRNDDLELATSLSEEMKGIKAEIAELESKTPEVPETEPEEVAEEQEEVEEAKEVEPAETAEENNLPTGEKRNMPVNQTVTEEVVFDHESEVRSAFTHYIATGEKRAGLTTDSGAVIVPTEIAREVVDYTDDVTALANLVQVKNVSNGQGEIAFFDGTSMPALPAVPELELNPMLGIQAIKRKQFKVETYRGYFPVSKESIEDGIGAIQLVKSLLNESVVATQNKLILDILNAKQAVSVADADGLKKILNVDLAPKYKKHIVVSQSAYNNLDTLKDGNGRYLLQDSITAASGKQLFGMQVTVVEDALIGENTMYVGDLAATVGLVDRSRYDAQWTSYMQFAECLMVAVRLDAIELNPKAVVKVTFAPTV